MILLTINCVIIFMHKLVHSRTCLFLFSVPNQQYFLQIFLDIIGLFSKQFTF